MTRAPPGTPSTSGTVACGARAAVAAPQPTKPSGSASSASTSRTSGVVSGPSWASAPAMLPSHTTGATAGRGRGSRVSEASDRRSKCSASSGAVPSVAATVDRDRLGQRPGQPAQHVGGADPRREQAERQRPTGKRQLPARIAARARVQRERHRDGEQAPRTGAWPRPAEPAASAAAPITPARWIDGPASAAARRARPARAPRPSARAARSRARRRCRRPGARAARRSARSRQNIAEARGPERLARVVVEGAVLAEHHAAGQGPPGAAATRWPVRARRSP